MNSILVAKVRPFCFIRGMICVPIGAFLYHLVFWVPKCLLQAGLYPESLGRKQNSAAKGTIGVPLAALLLFFVLLGFFLVVEVVGRCHSKFCLKVTGEDFG